MHGAAKCCAVPHFLGQTSLTSRARITVNLGKAQHQELRTLAKLHNVSMSWIAQVAIERLLDQHKQREFQFPLDLEQGTS